MNKPIVSVDFDGVIHQYSKGWQDGSIYDHVTPGFFDWLEQAVEHFRICIVSSRLGSNLDNILKIQEFFEQQWDEHCRNTNLIRPLPNIEYHLFRPPSLLTIDDRSFTFMGNWSAPELQPEAIKAFKPWNSENT